MGAWRVSQLVRWEGIDLGDIMGGYRASYFTGIEGLLSKWQRPPIAAILLL